MFINIKFIIYTAGKSIHQSELIKAGKERVVKNLSDDVVQTVSLILLKLKFKNRPAFSTKLQFIAVSRVNLREKKRYV